MSWWEEEIDKDTALQFLEECRAYTLETIQKKLPELKQSQFNHYHQSEPLMALGAVVHSSKTKTIWDALRVIAYGSHASHFIVTNHRPTQNSKYELLSEMPCAIMCPMPIDHPVPGNGYLSKFTYAIELRHIGKLRPWFGPFENTKPSPIFYGEEGTGFFTYKGKAKPKFYWWDDLWRAEFNSHVRQWHNFYYEVPTFNKICGLIALLRVLNAATEEYELDKRLVVPSNCVGGGENLIPFIDWSMIREYVFSDEIDLDPIDLDSTFPPTDMSDEWNNSGRRDEAFIAMHVREHSWRTNPDDGHVRFLLQGKNVIWPSGMKWKYKNMFNEFGFDGSDIDFAARMFAIAYGIRHANVQDVTNVIGNKLDMFKGM